MFLKTLVIRDVRVKMGGLELEGKERRCNYRVGLPGSSAWNYRAVLNPGWSGKQIKADDQIKKAAAKRA